MSFEQASDAELDREIAAVSERLAAVVAEKLRRSRPVTLQPVDAAAPWHTKAVHAVGVSLLSSAQRNPARAAIVCAIALGYFGLLISKAFQ